MGATKHFLYGKIINTKNNVTIAACMAAIAAALVAVSEISFSQTSTTTFYVMLALMAGSIFILWLNEIVSSHVSGIILYLFLTGIITYSISNAYGILDEGRVAYPIMVILAGLLLGKNAIIPSTTLTVIQIVFLHWISLRGYPKNLRDGLTFSSIETFNFLVVVIGTAVILWILINIIEKTIERLTTSEAALRESYDLTLQAWAESLELRGREVHGHSQRVVQLTVEFARFLGLPEEEVEQLRRGALLHDIGKMGLPEEILFKPGPLNAEEWQRVKQHPLMAEEIFGNIPYLQGARDVVLYHHEQVDGQGYPSHLKDNEIPLSAKIVALIDNWDMLRINRVYNHAWSDEAAAAYIQEQAGKKFDPQIVNQFLAFLYQEKERTQS